MLTGIFPPLVALFLLPNLDRAAMKTFHKCTIVILALAAFEAINESIVSADVIQLNATGGAGAVTIDFESTFLGSNNGKFAGAGFTPGATSAGQLDSDSWSTSGWSDGSLGFGGSGTTGDFARGVDDGNVSTGGIYAFDTSAVAGGSTSLGIQPTEGDFTPGSVTLRVQNNTGVALSNLSVAYEIWSLNNTASANSFNFSYSTDGAIFSNVSALDFISTEGFALGAQWEKVDRSAVGLSLSVLANQFFYLRWTGDDFTQTGARDEFGLDNIVFSANSAAVPEPTGVAFILAGGLALAVRRFGKTSDVA